MTFATGLIAGKHGGRVAVVLLALTIIRASSAQEDASGGGPTRRGISEVQREVPNVRLNHVSATWESVLNELADDTGCTLVLHDTPPGRYSRRDWRKHTPSEAVRILNQELELLGYRILFKDQFLTVIQIERTRTEYPAYEVSGTESRPAERREPAGVLRADWLDETGARGFRPLGDLSRRASVADGRIIQVDDEQPAAEEETAAPAVKDQPIAVERVVTQHPASEIAGQLYEAFRDRSDLIESGPSGLPAFQAYRQPLENGRAVFGDHPPAGQPAWFLVEVDGRANSLVVHAPADTARGVGGLIRELDAPRTDPKEKVRVVIDAGEDVDALADRLNREMQKARLGRRHIALAQQQQADGTAQAPAPEEGQPAPMQGMEFPGLIGTLRGDVTIESLPELDLLIIRGNEDDVAAVMAVINTIEQMAEGAAPIIDLHFLDNVDSEALAELLNQVYDGLSELSSDSAATRQTRPVTIIAVGNPNAILILAPANAIEDIKKLVLLLDVPVAAGTEVEVFHLRSAVASQVVTTLQGFYTDRPGLGTDIRIVADVRTNSVIVNARPNELAEVRKLVRQIDRDSTRGEIALRHIQLQHALADELADFLNTLVQSVLNPAQTPTGQGGLGAGGQAAQELRDTRSVVLKYLATSDEAQRVLRSGLLSDVRFNADLRTNSLLVTAPESSMKFFEELVRILDQPTTTVADIKVFPLKNADAEAAAELLQTLFPEQEEGELGVQIAGAEEGASGLVPLRVDVDYRSNSVIAVGSRELLDMVGAILFKLDSAEQLNRETQVLRLHNNPAQDISNAINQFLQSQQDLLTLDPDRVSSSQVLEQAIIVTPEPISNTLIISSTPRYIDTVLELAKQLDREPDQVMIQALIVEVTLEDTDEFGVELGFQDSLLFDRSAILSDGITTISQTMQNASGISTTSQQVISQSATPGFAFNNNPLGNNTVIHPAGVGTQGLSNFALGRTNQDLGFGGLILSASSESVSVLLRALASRRNVEILSRPQVLALDNQPAQVQVGQDVPIVVGFNPPTGTVAATPLIDRDEAGIILTVQPRISPDGQIVMNVAAEKSEYLEEGVPLYVDPTTGATIESPVKDITTATSTVKVPDGQTIVLGGMITRTHETIHRRVPWLGDVPILGNLFRYDFHNHRRTELLIFLTPRVIHNDADSELIKQIENDRLHWFEDEGEMVHGPLFGIPAPPAELPPVETDGQPPILQPMNVEPNLVPPLPKDSNSSGNPMSGMSREGNLQAVQLGP